MKKMFIKISIFAKLYMKNKKISISYVTMKYTIKRVKIQFWLA